MFDYIRELVYSDKIFENKVLGKVSCGAFNDSLTECKQYNSRSKGADPCVELKMLSKKCYAAANKEEIDSQINKEFEETLMLIKFLQKRGSALPEKLLKNTWGVFSNARNLQQYQGVRLQK